MSNIRPIQQTGFTLVELLIVVIILAILAAIVVPQFSASTDDAKAAALDSNTNSLRQSMNLYYQQHGNYPGDLAATSPSNCPSASAAPSAAETARTDDALIAQLTMYTNASGGACNEKVQVGGVEQFPYGPYIRTIPENPNNNLATIDVLETGSLSPVAEVSTTLGWRVDVVSGALVANN